jgi:predicted MFS family arabinose efflux permease
MAAIGFVVVLTVYRAPPGPASPASASGLGLGFLSAKDWQLLLICSLPWMLYNAAFQIVISFLPSIFVGNGFGIKAAGSLIAVNTVLLVLGVQAGGFLLKQARRPDEVCYFALAVWCLSLLPVASSTNPLPWLVVGGLIGGIPAAALVSLPAEFLAVASRGAGMGVFYTVYYLGCAILPAAAGGLYDGYGGQSAIWMAAGLAFACVPTLWLFRRASVRQ